jgi:hypothetical protein
MVSEVVMNVLLELHALIGRAAGDVVSGPAKKFELVSMKMNRPPLLNGYPLHDFQRAQLRTNPIWTETKRRFAGFLAAATSGPGRPSGAR